MAVAVLLSIETALGVEVVRVAVVVAVGAVVVGVGVCVGHLVSYLVVGLGCAGVELCCPGWVPI